MMYSYHFASIALIALLTTACSNADNVQQKQLPSAPDYITPNVSSKQCYTGEVIGARRHALYSEVSAKVVSVMAKPGDSFITGDTLLVMDASSVKTELKRLTERIDADNAALAKLIQSRDRTRNLFIQGAVDSASLDQLNYDVAEKQHLIAAAEAELESQMIQLTRHRITAPFSGRLLRASVESGEYLMQGNVAVEIMQTDSGNEIEIEIGAQNLDKWRIDQKLSIEHEGVTNDAAIIETEQTVNPSLYRLKVLSETLNAVPGEQVPVCTNAADQVWKVPVSAVKIINGEAFIWLEHASRGSHLTPVILRDANDNFFFLTTPDLSPATSVAENVGLAQQWFAHHRTGHQQ